MSKKNGAHKYRYFITWNEGESLELFKRELNDENDQSKTYTAIIELQSA
jgi:hypothetical protein